ncbi:zinc finger protein 91-like isoform X2 [Anoplophora glabripennis]|uniref:zinc finger protein 91-like isoform X2 n=1 Tax=Anoplophora glabripennis TaxID=217634 RepID=UPI000873F5A9|nr:zinc finger protein 91-like isoform X2 [Anoplophora glabripennis]
MADLRLDNFQSCCRLCLCEKMDTLKSVFDEAVEDRTLPQKISQFVAVEITRSDKITTMVCEQCVIKVNNWHEYKKECKSNQSKLEQWLKSSSTNGLADISLQIKEEPMNDGDDSNCDRPENDIVEVLVKNEPIDPPDEPMEEEYNELPPPLTPHPPNGTDSENSQDGSIPDPLEQDNVQATIDGQQNPEVPTPEQQKIQFAAGLKLLQKNATPISCEPLSKIELSYIEKCKAMVNMHRTLECACHNVMHPNLKGLLSHLRALRIWFPVFTCYNCMITFTDRSTFTRHSVRCPKSSLETIIKLSNLKKRSEVKTRLYQNFKCTSCKFMYSFHDDFCKHVDEDHSVFEPPKKCNCGRTFDNLEDYKDHVYVSCLVEYYCDICFITTRTLDDFQRHSAGVHDNSEGFILLQDDNYKMRKSLTNKSEVSDENVIVTGKRERRMSVKAPLLEPDEDEEKSKKKVYSEIIPSGSKICPICTKEYSSHNNMIRHYRSHLDVSPPKATTGTGGDSLYACPECGGMYTTVEWQQHLEEKHEPKTCGECGKIFQFQTELDQHRSVHLNLKVYRDSKTQSYKTSMLSPGSEGEVMLMCEVCDVMFPTKEELKEHKLTHENGLPILENLEEVELETKESKYSCRPCNKVYSSYGGIWDHNKKKHPEKKTPFVDEWPKQCPLCDKICATGAAYYRHKQIHEKERINADNAEVTPTKAPIAKGKNEEEEESYHTCKRCFKVFSSKYNLKNHMKSHGISPATKKIAKKVWCEICHQSFTSNEAMEKHKEEHTVEEQSQLPNLTDGVEGKVPFIFTCDVCVMTFTTKMALKKHKEKHAQETKPNVQKTQVYCKYCKIAFDSVAQLTKHMHVEHDETAKPKVSKDKPRQFTCGICKKNFLTASALSTHMGWHKRSPHTGGEGKPAKILKQNKITSKLANTFVKQEPVDPPEFQCVTCLAEFPNDTALQVHILEKHRSVSAIMLIPRCNTCNKDFNTQDEYETHKRLHDFLERQKQHELLMQQESGEHAADGKPLAAQPKFNKGFPCKYCNAAFSRADTLNGHVRQFHKEFVQNEFKCTQCDRIFDKQNSLTIHLKVHEKQKTSASVTTKPLFCCSICSMGFDLPKDLRAHTISAHPF